MELLREDTIDIVLPAILDDSAYCQYIYQQVMTLEGRGRFLKLLEYSNLQLNEIGNAIKCQEGLRLALERNVNWVKGVMVDLPKTVFYFFCDDTEPMTNIITQPTIFLCGTPASHSSQLKVLSNEIFLSGDAFLAYGIMKKQFPNARKLNIEEIVYLDTDIEFDEVSFGGNCFELYITNQEYTLNFGKTPKQLKVRFAPFLPYKKCTYTAHHIQATINMVTFVELYSNASLGDIIFPSTTEIYYQVRRNSMCNLGEFEHSFPNLKYVHLDSKFHEVFNEKTKGKYFLV